MKTKLTAMLVSLALIMCPLCGGICENAPAWPAGDPDHVAAVILHTNDVHGGFSTAVGYDGLSLYLKELRTVYDHVLLVDAGDAIQGDPIGAISKGTEIIRMMNRVGYDLAIVGNHEFDFGFDALESCSEELACGYICANFCTLGGESVFEPWRIMDVGEIKIGFVGAVAPDTFTKTPIKDIVNEVGEPMYDFLADMTGDRLAQTLQRAIDDMRAAGADHVILVSHLGNDDSVTKQFRSEAILAKLTGVDMVMDGHSHETFNKTAPDAEGNQIPIAQTGTKMAGFGQLTIYRDGRVEEKLIDEVPVPADLPFETVSRDGRERAVDSEMKEFLDGIVASYADRMDRRIGTLGRDMIVWDAEKGISSRLQENSLCELVADAFQAAGGAQIALVNAGIVRTGLTAGPITYNDIISVLPYSNNLMTVAISGQTLLDALEFAVSDLPSVSPRFPQMSGISFRVDREIPSSVQTDASGQFIRVSGAYRVSDVMIGDEPLDPNTFYTMTTTDYVLSGGDGFTMLRDTELISAAMMTDNEALIRFITEDCGGVIPEMYHEPLERLQWADEAEADAA